MLDPENKKHYHNVHKNTIATEQSILINQRVNIYVTQYIWQKKTYVRTLKQEALA